MDKTAYISYTSRNFREIPQTDKLSEREKKEIEIVASVLPFKTNNFVINNLINWDNIPEDPIYTLTFPRKEMLRQDHFDIIEKCIDDELPKTEIKNIAHQIQHELNPNPASQLKNIPIVNGEPLAGVQHKYRETVLFFPSQGQTCHAYCTFCFRWPQFTGISEIKFSTKETEQLYEYLRNHLEITDFLFTGGDPMTMKAKILEQYIEPILKDELHNIQTIRIGTKSLSYWPYRYLSDDDSDDLIRLFEKIVKKGINLSIMAHFNHPIELEPPEVREAIKRILETGAQIRTQSPIIKHINDKPEIWSEMWRKQVNLSIIPYYLFIERNTGAQHFFAVKLVDAWNIFRKAYQSVSGICRTVRGPSMSSTPGKVQVLGVSEIKGEKVFVLRFIQGRNPEWVARPFFATYDENAKWLSDLKPAFGESKFFFEDDLLESFGIKYFDSEENDFE